MFGIGFVFVFGISVSIFFSRADARSRRKQVSKQKWFLGHVPDCMQRRSNGSCLVIALRVAAWSKTLPAPRISSRLLSVKARFAARVCGQRAHCLRPVEKESSKRAQSHSIGMCRRPLARATCTLLAVWRRKKVPNEPSSIHLAAWAALRGAPVCVLRRAGRPAWPCQGGACCNTLGKQ